MQNKAVFYFHFDIFIFENKVVVEKMQLDGQFAHCPVAVECPGNDWKFNWVRYAFYFWIYKKQNQIAWNYWQSKKI